MIHVVLGRATLQRRTLIATPPPPPRPDAELGAPRWRLATLMLLGFGVVAVVAAGVLATRLIGGRPCSEDDLSLAEQIDHYGTAELEFFDDPEGSGCAAQLEVSATADDVLGHYERELEAEGWDVSIEDVPTVGPPGEDIIVRDLTARRGDAELTIGSESFSGRTSAAIRVDAG